MLRATEPPPNFPDYPPNLPHHCQAAPRLPKTPLRVKATPEGVPPQSLPQGGGRNPPGLPPPSQPLPIPQGPRQRKEAGQGGGGGGEDGGLTRMRLKRLLSLGGSGTDGMVRARRGGGGGEAAGRLSLIEREPRLSVCLSSKRRAPARRSPNPGGGSSSDSGGCSSTHWPCTARPAGSPRARSAAPVRSCLTLQNGGRRPAAPARPAAGEAAEGPPAGSPPPCGSPPCWGAHFISFCFYFFL